jgi:predicted PurR-regulated permease PerM
MKQVLKYAGYILILFIAGFLIWKFSYLLVWILLAAILSFVGQPLVRLFDKIHIKKWGLPHSFSAMLALLLIILLITGLVAIFVPLIISQAQAISHIDGSKLLLNLQGPLQWIDLKLHTYGVVPPQQSFQDFILVKAKEIVSFGSISNLINGFISIAGNFFISLFSIFFIAFFFLKDENMFTNGLLLIVNEEHHDSTIRVINDSKKLLMRYFIGIFLELLGVMTLITIGLWVLGIKNALLIGFFGGIMNVIPYLGPIIGASIGMVLGLTNVLAGGVYNEIMPDVLKLLSVFLAANLIDSSILAPYIYSKSVKSHPLEIFLVIIMGGGIAGLPGMLFAVPSYTVLRVFGKEFFQQFRVVKKLTQKIN